MASPPPLGHPKRKSVGNAVQDGVKRFKSYLQHPSPDVGGSSGFPSTNAASSPPSRSASPGLPIAPQCSSVQSNSAAPSALAGPTSASFLLASTTGTDTESHASRPKQTTTSVLTSLLQAMHIGSDLVNFSPLKPAISGVVNCLDIVQAATTSAKEYEELTLELNEMARALKAYIDEQGFEKISDSMVCTRIGWSIEAEVEHITKKKDRNKMRRAAESLDDTEDVIQCYRRVEGMFRRLHNEICLQSLRNSNNEQLMRLHEYMDPVDDARYNSGYSTTIEWRGCTKETREQVQADLQNWAQDPNGAKVYWMNGMAGTGKTTLSLQGRARVGRERATNTADGCIFMYVQIYRRRGTGRGVGGRIRRGAGERRGMGDRAAKPKSEGSPGLVAYPVPTWRAGGKKDNAGWATGELAVAGRPRDHTPSPCVASRVVRGVDVGVREKGYGKSRCVSYLTIAYSLCEWLETHQKPGASFFCSRASSLCRNVNSIMPTVAYELARHFPSFRSALHKVLRWDPGARKLNATQQFEKIILDPIVSLTAKCPTPINAVIVIDALDECEDEAGVRLVLQALLRLSARLQLKFFVTSRPEPAIRDKMLSPGGYSPAVLHLHDIVQSIVEGDLKKYLAEGLKAMSPPPSVGQIEQLTKLAGKLFIYAVTVTRYILPGKVAVNSTTQLNAILAADYQVTHQGNSSKKYKQLDELYTTVLAVALDDDNLEEEEIEAVRLVLWTAVCAKEPISIPTLALFLSLAQEQLSSVLQPLRSVLHVSEHDGFISPFHGSFPDYLHDSSRSGRFCCKQTSHNELMANSSFSLMKSQLRFNICKLETSSVLDKDVPDPVQWITSNISPSLLYACVYWVDHLCLAGPSDTLHDMLVDFLSHRLLFWMEVLNLRQSIAKGITVLSRAEIWLQALSNSAAARQLTSDANNFVSRPFPSAPSLARCMRATGADAWASRPIRDNDEPQKSSCTSNVDGELTGLFSCNHFLWQPYHDIISGDDCGNIYIRDGRTSDLIDVRFPKHNGAIRSLALSQGGTRIASGFDSSSKYAIRIWDASTGDAVVEPFGLLLDTVSSVAFSPDCRHIVSSSDTCTVRLWGAFTGEPMFPSFYGHTDSINSIALSPDGGCIASGSSDCAVRLWNATTGDIVAGPFRGYAGSVNSVVFSSGGTRIASGSDDKTIAVWDTQTGNLMVNRLQGHTGSVNSVAFSPDGALIASGCSDTTIQVWDAHGGKTVAGPFHRHKGAVNSVAFSPDGTRIASGPSDGTMLVWDVWAGDIEEGPLGEHTKSINSVAFSHDGTCVVWGSDDGVIQAWNLFTGNVLGKSFSEHESNVRSVAFSYDDTLIVSSSDDCTIRLWDRLTGRAATEQPIESVRPVKVVAFSRDGAQVFSCAGGNIRAWNITSGSPSPRLGPFQGHTGWVTSVAFSRNGQHIVSGSEDKTIRVWDRRCLAGC